MSSSPESVGGENVVHDETQNFVLNSVNVTEVEATNPSQGLSMYFRPGGQNTHEAFPWGMPGWVNPNQKVPIPNSVSTMVFDSLNQGIGGYIMSDPSSVSTVRQNRSQMDQLGTTSIDPYVTHSSLRQIVQEINQSTANVLAQHIGNVLSPLFQQMGRIVENQQNVSQGVSTNFTHALSQSVNQRGLNQSNFDPRMVMSPNMHMENMASQNLVETGASQQNLPQFMTQPLNLFANTQAGTGGQPHDVAFQNPPLNLFDNQFGVLHPTPNPHNQLYYQDAQQQLRNQNVERMVEQTLNKYGFNIGNVDQFVFSSPFPDEVQMVNLPLEYKFPKFTKFAGDTGESTFEHVARYLLECGEIASSELLRMKYFPCSLTKEAFSWFTTLAPKSIYSWSQLESLFHEEFSKRKIKIAISDLANVKRKSGESIDDYLIRLKQLKSRCSTPIPEIELVKMAIKGLDFSLRNKLIEHHVVNMFQLADMVRTIEKSNFEKGMSDKFIQHDQVEYPDEEDTSDPYTSSSYVSSLNDEDNDKVIHYIEPERFEVNMVDISYVDLQSHFDHVEKMNKNFKKKVFTNESKPLHYLLSRKKDFDWDGMLCSKQNILFDQVVLKQYIEKNNKFFLKIPSKVKFSEVTN